jgi:CheY-like chemotaxis protein
LGTTFTIYLPLAEPVSSAVSVQEREELRGGNEVILVAEDNKEVRQIVTTVLRDFGYQVIEAVDGVEAVEKFKEQGETVDLLLLDIIMPRKNGKEAYTELKEIRPDIPAIFMSGYTGDILSKKGISREGIPVISKPIAIEKLLRSIREMLDTKPSQLSLFP